MVTGLHLHSAFQHHHGTPERFTVASHSLAPRPRRQTGTERDLNRQPRSTSRATVAKPILLEQEDNLDSGLLNAETKVM